MSLRILLVGNGGREHALAWKLAQSPLVERIFVAPGNGGTDNPEGKIENVAIGSSQADFAKLVEFAQSKDVGLVIPGPEQPLVEGIETHFRKVGIPVFGPSEKAAVMEGSKTFSKDFMKKHNIPTAAFENFTDYNKAVDYVKKVGHRVVIKASGLAAGKGVLIPTSTEEAIAAVKEVMQDKAFGEAGDEVVIEEFLEGDELSILAFSDGYTVVDMPPAQDHKRVGDGDQGLNTGGMGAYCPAPIGTPALLKEIKESILQPTIDGMRRDGIPFVGMLFTGIMLTPDGKPKVLEYNVRFGDPETQTILPLLSDDTDLAEVMLACVERRLDAVTLRVKPDAHAVTVVMSAGGYPESYKKGDAITVGGLPEQTYIFHAGTASENGQVVTAGGRVIASTAVAPTLKDAVAQAYKGADAVEFNGKYNRKDIAYKAFRDAEKTSGGITYAQAGVSIDNGNKLVQQIKEKVKSTARPGTDSVIGGFGGLFDLKAAGFRDPLLVGATDGVGTKLKIAQSIDKHDTVGIDLVAMNVNDLVVQGAEPLVFLDYYATGKLDVNAAAAFVGGVADGCIQAGCALIGGETAEMPGIYYGNDYDANGTSIGAVERDAVLPRMDEIAKGDAILGLASSGVHSNGFSLVRKIIEHAGLTYTDACPWDESKSLGEALLTPTRIYVKQLLPVINAKLTSALAHITGGGLVENIPRILPENFSAKIDVSTWPLPPVFQWLGKAGNVPKEDISKTLNMGIGMILVVKQEKVAEVKEMLEKVGEKVYQIGEIVPDNDVDEKTVLTNTENWY